MDTVQTFLSIFAIIIYGLDYIESCSPRPPVTVWTKELFPNPRTDTDEDYCKRYCQRSWICNPDNIIRESDADQLDQKIEEIWSSGVCGCEDECFGGGEGYSIAVAILSKIKVEDGLEVKDAMDEFATYLRTKWNYGKCGNNVIIVLATDQRQVQIDTGPAAKHILTNKCVNHITGEIKDLLTQEDYITALDHLVTRFGEIFKDKICDIEEEETDDGWTPLQIIVACICIVIFLLVVCNVIRLKVCRLRNYIKTGKLEKGKRVNSVDSLSSVSNHSDHSHHDCEETNVDGGDEGTNADDGGGGDGGGGDGGGDDGGEY